MDAKYSALKSVDDISILKGQSFEDFLCSVFSDLGYSVELTPSSGDYGADLILARDEKKVVVQAKQYSKPVGFDAIKEAHFARTFYSATDAWVIATHGFTQQAISAADATDIRLIDGNELVSYIAMADAEKSLDEKNEISSKSLRIDSDLLKASRLIVSKGNPLPGYLEKKMGISFERASRLLNQMVSLGILSDDPKNRKAIISNEDYIQLINSHYNPSVSKPRFCDSTDHPFEVFQGSDSDTIMVVDKPTSLPSFYTFELDPTKKFFGKWVCVGIDQLADTTDTKDISNRLRLVSQLKLYDVINFTDETEYEYDSASNKMEEKRICKDYNSVQYAFDQARTGESELHAPGYVKNKLEAEKQRKAAEEAEKDAIERKRLAEEEKRAAKRRFVLLALIVLALCFIAIAVARQF